MILFWGIKARCRILRGLYQDVSVKYDCKEDFVYFKVLYCNFISINLAPFRAREKIGKFFRKTGQSHEITHLT